MRANFPELSQEITTQIENIKPSNKVIGFVVFGVINSNNNIRKTYFDISDRIGATFPKRGDFLTVNKEKVALRSRPFHWNIESNSIFMGTTATRYVEHGQKIKVAGDIFITTDPTNKEQYAIAPVSEIVGVNFFPPGDVYSPVAKLPKVAGYTYFGRIDEQSGKLVDRTFRNETRADALYPAANDKLSAVRDVWLRAGPRAWNEAENSYVNAEQLVVIKSNQRVLIAGDAILARDGLSVWVPIAKLLTE
ncbi:hypothetical protein LJR090_001775 [Bosea sp. LjRoot90]